MLRFKKSTGEFFDTKSDSLSTEGGFADCMEAMYFCTLSFSKLDGRTTVFKAFRDLEDMVRYEKRINKLKEKGYIKDVYISFTKERHCLPRHSRVPGNLTISNFYKCELIMNDLFPKNHILYSVKYKSNVVRRITLQ